MGANLWGASPLWEYRLGRSVSKDKHWPTARATPRGFVWRKPECKAARQQTANRIVKAEGCCWRWHMTAKPTGTRLAGLAEPVARPFARHKQSTGLFLSGFSLRSMRRLCPDSSHSCLGRSALRAVRLDSGNTGMVEPGYQEPSAVASCPLRVEEAAATTLQTRAIA